MCLNWSVDLKEHTGVFMDNSCVLWGILAWNQLEKVELIYYYDCYYYYYYDYPHYSFDGHQADHWTQCIQHKSFHWTKEGKTSLMLWVWKFGCCDLSLEEQQTCDF